MAPVIRYGMAGRSLKVLVPVSGERYVESVLISRDRGGSSACLSSQAGCAMECLFCATGRTGLEGNLTPGDMVRQFEHLDKTAIQKGLPRPTSVVFMGMGEPFHNYDAVREAIDSIVSSDNNGVVLRRCTVSTAAPPGFVERYVARPPYPSLAVSIVTADRESRTRLLPRSTTLDEIRRGIVEIQLRRRRRITLEIVMIAGVTDSDTDARAIADWVQTGSPINVLANLISWNPVPGTPFSTPSRGRVEAFSQILMAAGIPTTIRFSPGAGSFAACGQLRPRRADTEDAVLHN